jgi:thiol:disulfide interchange protein
MLQKLSVLVLSLCLFSTVAAEPLNWFTEPTAAFAKAQATGKPIFTDVFTTWCSWCKKLDEETFSTPEFQAEAARFVLLKVDGDKYPTFKTQHGVPGYPTMLFLNAEDQEIHTKVVGFKTADKLVPIMKEVPASVAPQMTSDISWYTVPEKAFEAAKAQRKPIFTDVFTTWCHWCKKLDEETFSAPQFHAEAARFILLKVDGDQYSEFVLKYSVSGYPTMLFLNGDGQEIHAKAVGFKTADKLVPIMKEVK